MPAYGSGCSASSGARGSADLLGDVRLRLAGRGDGDTDGGAVLPGVGDGRDDCAADAGADVARFGVILGEAACFEGGCRSAVSYGRERQSSLVS
jgi:hypothetical protein